jgi:hypothetical protein
MSIAFACTGCGKSFKVKDELAGRKAKCSCGQMMTVPAPVVEPPEEDIFAFKEDEAPKVVKRAPAMAAAPSMPATSAATTATLVMAAPPYTPPARVSPQALAAMQASSGGGATRRFAYLLLLAAMIPLVMSTLSRKEFKIGDALARTVEKHPEIEKKIVELTSAEEVSEEALFDALPDHRFEGALLSHDSYAHWMYALLSSVVFTAMILFIFPRSTQSLGKMLLVGLFTATAGIFLLLGFQWVAEATQGSGFAAAASWCCCSTS